jgi:hypothetical protein
LSNVDTYAKVACAKLYDRKTSITAADLLNDRVLPFYEENGIVLQRVLTDRGTEYCGTHDRHEYELYLVGVKEVRSLVVESTTWGGKEKGEESIARGKKEAAKLATDF